MLIAGEGEQGQEYREASLGTSGALWEKLRPLAREMRNQPTPAEDYLWQQIRREQLGAKFRRQFVIERFIVDFYCPEAHLVIEVDGGIHQYTEVADAVRQEFLESQGLRVLRFSNDAVLDKIANVIQQIRAALPSDSPSPVIGERGGGLGVNRTGIPWRPIVPDVRNTWLVPEQAVDFAALMPLGSKETKAAQNRDPQSVFKLYSLGVVSSRDSYVYSFDYEQLQKRVEQFTEVYNGAVDVLKRRTNSIKPESLIEVNDQRIKWSRQVKGSLLKHQYSTFDQNLLRNSLYRPFTKMHLYFDNFWNEERYQQHLLFPTPETEQENRAICLPGLGHSKSFQCLMVNTIPGHDTLEKTQCFPFYVYDRDGTNRRENITDWALAQFRMHYADDSISKWDIFYYVYGALHHPGYREKFADNLKRELPRIPFAPELTPNPPRLTPNPQPLSPITGEGEQTPALALKSRPVSGEGSSGFHAFADSGHTLADLHLNYETVAPYKLRWIEAKDKPLSYHVEKMRLSKDKTQLVINESLTLADIPPEAFAYRLGNRSALEWVIDQYQVTTDKRSGITSDPNREDEPRYIVDLVGRVIQVSVETVRIVAALPTAYSSASVIEPSMNASQ